VFRSSASLIAVCEYCRSTLVRTDADVKRIGKMSDPVEDGSPLQCLAQGNYQGRHFTLIGRIQCRYSDGMWNEWHALFDDQSSGWLSEASGDYVFTLPQSTRNVVPSFESFQLGQKVGVANQSFSAVSKREARVVAGEGELPFLVNEGYDIRVIDLRSAQDFLTLDYSDVAPTDPQQLAQQPALRPHKPASPAIYLGRAVSLSELKMSGLKTRAAGNTKAVRFSCPGCGTSLEIKSSGAVNVACGSCASVVDVTGETYQVVAQYKDQRKHEPLIPLGSQGRLSGISYEVIGYMRRSCRVEDEYLEWEEYLLYQANAGFHWLVFSEDKWSLCKPLRGMPEVKAGILHPSAKYLGKVYSWYCDYAAQVEYVLGEFYWQIRVGDNVEVTEYLQGTNNLVEERNQEEINWTLSQFVPAQNIVQAFKLDKTLHEGAAMGRNQPNLSWAETRELWSLWSVFAMIGLFIWINFEGSFNSFLVELAVLGVIPGGAMLLSSGNEYRRWNGSFSSSESDDGNP